MVSAWPLVFVPANQETMSRLAVRHRLPAMHSVLMAPENGALMTYASDQIAAYARVPYFVDRLLKGARPTDLPIEQHPASSSSSISRPPGRSGLRSLQP